VRHCRVDLADDVAALASTKVPQQLVKLAAFVSDFQLRRQSPVIVVRVSNHCGRRYLGSPPRWAFTASRDRAGRKFAASEILE
jgi:hypothetical protein